MNRNVVQMQTSFQAILAQFLEEESEAKAQPKAAPYVTTKATPLSATAGDAPLWDIPRPKAIFRRGLYPVSATPSRPKKLKSEPLVAFNRLSQDHQKLVLTLTGLGATELSQGISLNTLKRAYRHLAKQLHPDMATGSAQRFLELRKAYEGLRQALPSYAACSGCASESETPHPAAA